MAQACRRMSGRRGLRVRAPLRVKGKLVGLGRGDRELGAAEHFLREAQTVGGWRAVGGVLAAGGV